MILEGEKTLWEKKKKIVTSINFLLLAQCFEKDSFSGLCGTELIYPKLMERIGGKKRGGQEGNQGTEGQGKSNRVRERERGEGRRGERERGTGRKPRH